MQIRNPIQQHSNKSPLLIKKASSWISLSLPPQSSKFPNSPKVMSLAMEQWYPESERLGERDYSSFSTTLWGCFLSRELQASSKWMEAGHSGNWSLRWWRNTEYLQSRWGSCSRPAGIMMLPLRTPCPGRMSCWGWQFSSSPVQGDEFLSVLSRKGVILTPSQTTWKWRKGKGNNTCWTLCLNVSIFMQCVLYLIFIEAYKVETITSIKDKSKTPPTISSKWHS